MDVIMSQASQGRKRGRNPSVFVVKKKRKIGKRKTTRLVVRQLGQIMPDKFVTSLTYCHIGQEAPAVTAQYDHQFNMNSIYDPDRSGGGHQPLGRDQLSTLYSRYRVIACKWIVDFMPEATPGPILCVTIPNNEAGALTGSSQTAVETPYAKYKTTNALSTAIATDVRHVRISGSADLAKIYGVSKETLMSDDRYAAASGADPSEFAILHVCGFSIDGNAIVVQMCVKLIYTVEFYDRVQLTAS